MDFHFGALVIPSHPLFETLSFILGWQYYRLLRNRKGDFLTEDYRWTLVIGAALGALIGSRLLASLESPALFLHPPSWLYYIAGKTVVGGIVGGIFGVEITKWITGTKRRTGDLYAFPLLFAIMIGRVGCLLTGVSDHTVGLPSNLPWAFDQGDGIARHPTSLYEILFLGIFWFMLSRLAKKVSLKEGELFRLSIIGYFIFRFFVEFIKPMEPIALGISAIQWVILFVILYYGFSLWTSRSRPNSQNGIESKHVLG